MRGSSQENCKKVVQNAPRKANNPRKKLKEINSTIGKKPLSKPISDIDQVIVPPRIPPKVQPNVHTEQENFKVPKIPKKSMPNSQLCKTKEEPTSIVHNCLAKMVNCTQKNSTSHKSLNSIFELAHNLGHFFARIIGFSSTEIIIPHSFFVGNKFVRNYGFVPNNIGRPNLDQ